MGLQVSTRRVGAPATRMLAAPLAMRVLSFTAASEQGTLLGLSFTCSAMEEVAEGEDAEEPR